MNQITQYYIRTFRPRLNGLLTKLIYRGKEISIGRSFIADSIPKIIIDKGCRLIIGDHVEFRRNVELRLHKESCIHLKDNSRIDRGVRILASNKSTIAINQSVRIGLYTVLNGGDSISIGEKCLISGFVYLQTSMHAHEAKNISIQDQGYIHGKINIEENAWLGTHVIIMPGVTVHKGAIVGSNAVVTKNVEETDIVAGIPAKSIKK